MKACWRDDDAALLTGSDCLLAIGTAGCGQPFSPVFALPDRRLATILYNANYLMPEVYDNLSRLCGRALRYKEC